MFFADNEKHCALQTVFTGSPVDAKLNGAVPSRRDREMSFEQAPDESKQISAKPMDCSLDSRSSGCKLGIKPAGDTRDRDCPGLMGGIAKCCTNSEPEFRRNWNDSDTDLANNQSAGKRNIVST